MKKPNDFTHRPLTPAELSYLPPSVQKLVDERDARANYSEAMGETDDYAEAQRSAAVKLAYQNGRKLRGVRWLSRKERPWHAQICCRDRVFSLGCYATTAEASAAYDNAAFHINLNESASARQKKLNDPAHYAHETYPVPTESTGRVLEWLGPFVRTRTAIAFVPAAYSTCVAATVPTADLSAFRDALRVIHPDLTDEEWQRALRLSELELDNVAHSV